MLCILVFGVAILPTTFLQAATYTDDSNDAGEFGGGTNSDTQWDAGNSWIEFDATGQSNGVATFTSRILNAESNARWDTLSWVPQRPTFKELPDNEEIETQYNAGNADMSSTTVLLHFNEAADSTSFSDSSGNGNTGSCVNCPTVSTTGRFNNAFTFDGSNDYVTLPSQSVGNLIGPTFTIAFWVHPGAVADLPTFGFTGSGGANSLNPIASYSGGVSIGNGGSSQQAPALPTAPANKWSHYAIVDSGTHYITYFNGHQVASTSINTHPGAVASRSFVIGQTGFDGGFEQYFAGAFDEFVIISRGLSSTEVLDMYKRGALRLRFQVRSCDDNACAGETFSGPDGTQSTFYTELSTSSLGLPAKSFFNVNRNQYFQYRTVFESSSTTLISPELKSVTVENTGAGVAGVTVTQSGGTTAVTEGGDTDSYTVVLDAQTIDDTSIALSVSSECTLSTSTIVFTSTTWSNAATVTVTAADDSVAEGTHTCQVSHTATSDDTDYNAIAISSVTATITDNDSAGVTITESDGSTTVTEAGATDTYTVVLTSQPTSTVTIAPALSDVTQASLSTSSIVFTSTTWNQAVTVTLTATNDSIAESGHTVTVTHTVESTNWNYSGIAVNSVVASITDNDTAGVTITESGGSLLLTEGAATDTYTVVLDTAPTSTVTITVTPDDQSTVSTSSITFTSSNWSDAVTVTVTSVNDSVAEGDHLSTITHTAASTNWNYSGIAVASATADITDNDSAGATVTASGGSVVLTEAGVTDTFTLVLTSAPTSTVTTTLSVDADATLSTSTIVFDSGNWSDAVTVTVTAVDDATVEGDHTATITFTVTSGNWNYNGLVIANLSASITDNDSAAEGGGGGGGGGSSGTIGSSNTGSVTPPTLPNPALVSPVKAMQSTLAGKAQTIQLSETTPTPITVSGVRHAISQVGPATSARVTVEIRSEPIRVVLLKGRSKMIDLDQDKKSDIRLYYVGLRENKPEVRITTLSRPTPPSPAIVINGGAATTSNRRVRLFFSVPDATSMALSEDAKFASSGFVPYVSSTSWKLSAGLGSKTVFARFRSESGGTADASASVIVVNKSSNSLSTSTTPTTIPAVPSSVKKNSKPIFINFLKQGHVGQEVRELQRILHSLHFIDVAPTGFFGPVTRAGLIAFQKAYGIDPFGYVGPATREALNRLYSD